MSSADTQAALNRFRFLAEAVAWRYRAQGCVVHWRVRQSLLHDPFFRELVAANRLPPEGVLLDIGCGRGVFLALLACAQGLGMVEGGKRGTTMRLIGLESRREDAESARLALAGEAEIIVGDVRETRFPPCRTAIWEEALLDLEPEAQDKLLERVVSSLEEGGLLVLRALDAESFACRVAIGLNRWALGLVSGERRKRRLPRSGQEWKTRLELLGLHVETVPMKTGMGFCKMLLLARKPSR